jgi:hypothetical protein
MKHLIQLKMKIIKIILFSLIAIGANAQKSPVDAIFDKYSEKEGFTTVFISKGMFSLFANPESEDNKDDFSKIISGLESIRILSIEDSVVNSKINLYKELIKDLPLDKYDQLMVVKEKNQEMRMMVRKSNGRILEFLMIGGGEDNYLISILGNIDLNAIAKLSKAMNIKELENVDKLESNSPEK